MDKFELELLAQLKEHNRLTKELVKIEQANFELSKDINKVNSNLVTNITDYCTKNIKTKYQVIETDLSTGNFEQKILGEFLEERYAKTFLNKLEDIRGTIPVSFTIEKVGDIDE